MYKNTSFVFIILLILIFFITFRFENFMVETNKYNIILINHKKYQIVIIKNKNINNVQDKIYKIYKN